MQEPQQRKSRLGIQRLDDDEKVQTMLWKAILAGVSPMPLWEATGIHAVANTGPTLSHQDSTCLLDFSLSDPSSQGPLLQTQFLLKQA